jgi:hypothetical protein
MHELVGISIAPCELLNSSTSNLNNFNTTLTNTTIFGMRFSTLAVSLLSGLSVFKGISASPIDSAALAKRQTIDEVVNDLKSAVVSLISYTPCHIIYHCISCDPFISQTVH